MNDIYPGISGRIHGDKKDNTPAISAEKNVGASIILINFYLFFLSIHKHSIYYILNKYKLSMVRFLIYSIKMR